MNNCSTQRIIDHLKVFAGDTIRLDCTREFDPLKKEN
jgi:hypothetical protein